jgi:hypothetical protein
MAYPDRRRRLAELDLPQYLDLARGAMAATQPEALAAPETTEDFEELRWFPYPHEVEGRRIVEV